MHFLELFRQRGQTGIANSQVLWRITSIPEDCRKDILCIFYSYFGKQCYFWKLFVILVFNHFHFSFTSKQSFFIYFVMFTRFRDIATFVLQHVTFPYPTSVSPKFPYDPLRLGGWPLGYKERNWSVGLIARAIPRFPTYERMSSQPTIVWDGRTDRQTTCDGKTALCTTVHRTVKKSNIRSNDLK